jgi:hypothetical protein
MEWNSSCIIRIQIKLQEFHISVLEEGGGSDAIGCFVIVKCVAIKGILVYSVLKENPRSKCLV